MSDELARMTLTAVADAIRRRKVSSLEVTQSLLARIDRLQPQLNCFISIERDDVLKAARKADRATARGKIGPLHGVPLAHKDMFYRAGRIATCGSKILRAGIAPAGHRDGGRTAGRSRRAVARRTQHGRIRVRSDRRQRAFRPLPQPVESGICYGRLKCPVRSAAAVAARVCYGGSLGRPDTGGSIRTPAGRACGVAFGLSNRPTVLSTKKISARGLPIASAPARS